MLGASLLELAIQLHSHVVAESSRTTNPFLENTNANLVHVTQDMASYGFVEALPVQC
jgi:hypothetical protein